MAIPDRAQVCAYCGAEFVPQWTTEVRTWLEGKGCVWILGILGCLFLLTALVTTPLGPILLVVGALVGVGLLVRKLVKNGGWGSGPNLRMTAPAIVCNYKENAVKANDEYLNKVITVCGKIKAIEEGENGGQKVTLKGIELGVVECHFLAKERRSVSALTRKEKINVRGTCRGLDRTGDVQLVNCKLIIEGQVAADTAKAGSPQRKRVFYLSLRFWIILIGFGWFLVGLELTLFDASWQAGLFGILPALFLIALGIVLPYFRK